MTAAGFEVLKLQHVYQTDGEGVGERRGTIGYYTGYAQAEEARGAQGSLDRAYTGVREVPALRISGNSGTVYFLLAAEERIQVNMNLPQARAALEQQALQKLTPEERRALGLKDPL